MAALVGNASVQVAGNAIAIRKCSLGGAGAAARPWPAAVAEGRGNLALDVRTRGETLGAMRTKLAGSAALDIKDGAVAFNLAKSLRATWRPGLGAAAPTPRSARMGLRRPIFPS